MNRRNARRVEEQKPFKGKLTHFGGESDPCVAEFSTGRSFLHVQTLLLSRTTVADCSGLSVTVLCFECTNKLCKLAY